MTLPPELKTLTESAVFVILEVEALWWKRRIAFFLPLHYGSSRSSCVRRSSIQQKLQTKKLGFPSISLIALWRIAQTCSTKGDNSYLAGSFIFAILKPHDTM
jgi:hypothetical protein